MFKKGEEGDGGGEYGFVERVEDDVVECLGEDEDDGGQRDGDVACRGDEELFLQTILDVTRNGCF